MGPVSGRGTGKRSRRLKDQWPDKRALMEVPRELDIFALCCPWVGPVEHVPEKKDPRLMVIFIGPLHLARIRGFFLKKIDRIFFQRQSGRNSTRKSAFA